MPGSVQSIERAAAMLRLLASASGDGRGCVEVANSLGLAKGTAHGILRTLLDVGFIEQDRVTGKYLLGDGLSGLAFPRPDVNVLRSLSLNWTDSLAARSGQTVRLGVLDDGDVLIAHHGFRPDDSRQTLEVGARRPAHACALGKVLLAHDADAAATALRLTLASFTPRTVIAPRELAAQLAQVRREGWALAAEELEMDTAGLAAPVRGRGGLTVAAVGITGPLERLCDGARGPRPTMLALVRDAAHAISRELAPQS